MDKLPDDARIQALELRPGDYVVISFPGPITDEQADWVARHAARGFDGHRVLVLSEGAEVAVVRPGRRGS